MKTTRERTRDDEDDAGDGDYDDDDGSGFVTTEAAVAYDCSRGKID